MVDDQHPRSFGVYISLQRGQF